ncbi:type III secretion system effector EspX1, partial [Escherichia coli]|nr:type III secretion system effector EspX1 [Escherichia coli]
IKEFILLLPYNKSLEMYELNEQKIQYLITHNININKLLLSNITIEKSNLSYGYYFGCVLSNISCFESDLSNTIFSNGDINNLFIKKSNIFGTSFTNTRIKNLRCEDIMPGRWTTQLVNKHLGYRYTGVFKTLASIDDKPSRFEILIPLIQTLVRDNVKLNNDVYKELNKFMLDYDKTSSEMRKYLQSINECILLMKNIVHQD